MEPTQLEELMRRIDDVAGESPAPGDDPRAAPGDGARTEADGARDPAPAPAPPAAPAGGRLLAAISSAMVRIRREHYGKGPTRARTYIFENFVVCVLEGGLTTVERTLVAGGATEPVRELRRAFADLLSPRYREAVETLTGRRVLAFETQTVLDAETTFEIFVLDGRPAGSGDGRATTGGS